MKCQNFKFTSLEKYMYMYVTNHLVSKLILQLILKDGVKFCDRSDCNNRKTMTGKVKANKNPRINYAQSVTSHTICLLIS